MAGMLPGVGVPQRRNKIINNNNKQHRQDFLCSPVTDVTCINNDLDENAVRARQRLQHKLGYLHPSSRSSSGHNHNNVGMKKDTSLGSKLLGSQWQLRIGRCKSYGKICSVCLEDFEEEQQITKLSCSHKYHSDCVLPWLAAHPHCPCCRRPAPVS